jgi:hypothetical protein
MSVSLSEPPKAGIPGRPIGAPPCLMMSKRYWSLSRVSARFPGRIRNSVARHEARPSSPWQLTQSPK